MEQMSTSIAALAKSLASAQSVMAGAPKIKINPHFKSKYADMEAVVDAIKKPLASNGISYTQLIEPGDGNELRVRTVLMHESGEWISGVICMPVAKDNAQAMGSALTYARRYSLMAIVGIASEDDDGYAADMSSGGKQAPAADHDPVIKAKFFGARTMDELGAVWASLDAEQRRRHADVKDARKAELNTKADRDSFVGEMEAQA